MACGPEPSSLKPSTRSGYNRLSKLALSICPALMGQSRLKRRLSAVFSSFYKPSVIPSKLLSPWHSRFEPRNHWGFFHSSQLETDSPPFVFLFSFSFCSCVTQLLFLQMCLPVAKRTVLKSSLVSDCFSVSLHTTDRQPSSLRSTFVGTQPRRNRVPWRSMWSTTNPAICWREI